MKISRERDYFPSAFNGSDGAVKPDCLLSADFASDGGVTGVCDPAGIAAGRVVMNASAFNFDAPCSRMQAILPILSAKKMASVCELAG